MCVRLTVFVTVRARWWVHAARDTAVCRSNKPHVHVYIHVYTSTCIQKDRHTYIHTSRTYVRHTYTHTHTHTHTQRAWCRMRRHKHRGRPPCHMPIYRHMAYIYIDMSIYTHRHKHRGRPPWRPCTRTRASTRPLNTRSRAETRHKTNTAKQWALTRASTLGQTRLPAVLVRYSQGVPLTTRPHYYA